MGIVKADRLARYVELIESEGFIDLLCQRVACGETLSEITRSLDVHYSRILFWLMDEEKRWEVYKRALEAQAHYEVDEALKIADGVEGEIEGASVSAAKLRVDTRFKRAAHHAPKTYGDKDRGGTNMPVRVVLVDFRRSGNEGRVIDVSPQPQRVAASAASTGTDQ